MKLWLSFSITVVSLLLNNFTNAQQSFGAWITGETDSNKTGVKLYFAATTNDSGNLLGQYCGAENCIWLLGMNSSCQSGDSYPVLTNSNKGSIPLYVHCDAKLDNGLYRYVFSNFDAINELIIKGTRIGFAFPLQSDEFRVVRFDLTGSSRAISTMGSAAQEGGATRDKVL